MKPTERELPPGLPPLPPGTRYAGQLKDYSDSVNGYTFNATSRTPRNEWNGPSIWSGMKYEEHFGFSENWHLALPIEDEAVPEVVKDGWLPIETAPTEGKKMFVIAAFGADVGVKFYNSDPYCVWPDGKGSWIRWPHKFKPTHWMPLPTPPKP